MEISFPGKQVTKPELLRMKFHPEITIENFDQIDAKITETANVVEQEHIRVYSRHDDCVCRSRRDA